MRYFLITGMDEGCPIESYAVMTDGQQPRGATTLLW